MWLKEGDRNTKFFPGMVNAHRRATHIRKMKIDGVELIQENANVLAFRTSTKGYTENWGLEDHIQMVWNLNSI